MKFSVDSIVSDGTVLIVSYPTGILYTAQCGGIGCRHPECEGFVLSLGSFASDFDDCSYGCHHIEDLDSEDKLKLARDIDNVLISESAKYRYHIGFDFDRINQLMEGWWPVTIHKLDDWEGVLRGFLHIGNCD